MARFGISRGAVAQYRATDAGVPSELLHKASQAQAKGAMATTGLQWIETRDVSPPQDLIISRRPWAALPSISTAMATAGT